MIWTEIATPPGLAAPHPMTVRAQAIPARHHFAEHTHRWGQLVYAISGVLTVAADSRSFAISPDQAVWLPPDVPHQVGSLLGAEFRSLWIAAEAGSDLPTMPTVIAVAPLLQALIVEAASFEPNEDEAYAARVARLILDQLRRAKPLPGALPWPCGGPVTTVCEALYTNPADPRGPDEWGREVGWSARTLARRFEAELGMSFRSWRRRLRLFKAVELLGGGLGVTQTAMELGYGSTSAFTYAFRIDVGLSPQAYTRGQPKRR